MVHLNPVHPPKRRESGVTSCSLIPERPDNDNSKPMVGFQYLQLVPMAAVFLVMVAIVWLITIVL